jgi:hypothetical protein
LLPLGFFVKDAIWELLQGKKGLQSVAVSAIITPDYFFQLSEERVSIEVLFPVDCRGFSQGAVGIIFHFSLL